MKPGQKRLRFFSGLGGAVAAVHTGEFTPLAADCLVETAQLLLLGFNRCFELFDRCVQGDRIGLFDESTKHRKISPGGGDRELVLTSGAGRLQPDEILRTALGLGKIAEIRAPRFLAKTFEANPCFLVLSLGCAETFLFAATV